MPVLEALGNVALDECNLVHNVSKLSLFDFMMEFWGEVATEDFTPNWHVKFLCDSIQEEMMLVLKREKKRYDYIIINIPPVCLKSTIFMMMLNAWFWAWKPSGNFIGCSYEASLAVEHSRKTRILVKSSKYRAVYPDVQIATDLDSKGTFGTTKGGARYSCGTKANVTGRHGDIVGVDDPLNPRAARSEADTLAVKQFILEALPNRKRLISIVPTIIVMQRLAEDDPTGMLLEMARNKPDVRIKHICLPAEYRDWVRPAYLKRMYIKNDGLLDPIRLDRDTLQSMKASGEYFYAGQYLQSPIPDGGSMFNTQKIHRNVSPPDVTNPKKWIKQVRYWDKASTQDDGCWTSGVRIGKDLDANWWVIHDERGQWEPYTREKNIRRVAEIDGHHVIQAIEEEGGSSGKDSSQNTIRRLAGYRVVTDRPTGDKVTRADPFATQVNGGNVYLAPEGTIPALSDPWHMVYLHVLKYFPHGKIKDDVDASSGAFKILTQPLRRIGVGWGKKRKRS